jgi:hypothetical protein
VTDEYFGRTIPQVSIKDTVMVADNVVINSGNTHLICSQCKDEGHITLSVCVGCENKFCQKCKARSKHCTQCTVAIKEMEIEQKRKRRQDIILEQEKILAQKKLIHSTKEQTALRKENIIKSVKVQCATCRANIPQSAKQCPHCRTIFKENTMVNKTRNLSSKKNSEWNKKWLNPSMEAYKLRKSREEKQYQQTEQEKQYRPNPNYVFTKGQFVKERPDLLSYILLTILYWMFAGPLGVTLLEIPFVWIFGIYGILLYWLWSGFLDTIMEFFPEGSQDEEMTIFKDRNGDYKIKKK